jgi:transcriptional repressor NrdR
MVCPLCFNSKTKVYNSRTTKRANSLWRRRRCPVCKKEFTTHETIDAEAFLLVTETGQKAKPFSKAKLVLSLVRACDHRQDESAYWLAETVEQKLIQAHANKAGPITTEDIKNFTLLALKRYDAQAFIKYLSYHADTFDPKALKAQLRKTT